jgi:hypothetical protein
MVMSWPTPTRGTASTARSGAPVVKVTPPRHRSQSPSHKGWRLDLGGVQSHTHCCAHSQVTRLCRYALTQTASTGTGMRWGSRCCTWGGTCTAWTAWCGGRGATSSCGAARRRARRGRTSLFRPTQSLVIQILLEKRLCPRPLLGSRHEVQSGGRYEAVESWEAWRGRCWTALSFVEHL